MLYCCYLRQAYGSKMISKDSFFLLFAAPPTFAECRIILLNDSAATLVQILFNFFPFPIGGVCALPRLRFFIFQLPPRLFFVIVPIQVVKVFSPLLLLSFTFPPPISFFFFLPIPIFTFSQGQEFFSSPPPLQDVIWFLPLESYAGVLPRRVRCAFFPPLLRVIIILLLTAFFFFQLPPSVFSSIPILFSCAFPIPPISFFTILLQFLFVFTIPRLWFFAPPIPITSSSRFLPKPPIANFFYFYSIQLSLHPPVYFYFLPLLVFRLHPHHVSAWLISVANLNL